MKKYLTDISKLKLSLSRINYKLFFALLVLGLTPTVYTTVRVFFLGQLPGEYSFSIAGQLSWVNLLYEILNEAIILPLFYFVGKVKDDKMAFSNRVRTGMLISLCVYAVLSAIVLIFAEPMLKLMATDASILELSASYIRIESIANIFSILTQFALVALVTINKSKYLFLTFFFRKTEFGIFRFNKINFGVCFFEFGRNKLFGIAHCDCKRNKCGWNVDIFKATAH